MDLLTLRTWCGGDHDLTCEIAKVEGICRTILSFRSEECKAAFLIWTSAIQLQKADAEITQNVSVSEPNNLAFHVLRHHYPVDPPMHGITSAHLGSFEDIYYAAVAKAKQLMQGVDILLDNEFKREGDVCFSYSMPPLNQVGMVTFGVLKTFLTTLTSLLLDQGLIEVLRKGIIEKMKQDKGSSTCSPRNHSQTHGDLKSIQQLDNIHNMNSAMIFAQLAEKYRASNTECISSPALQYQTYHTIDIQSHGSQKEAPPYISPWNLDERAKVFNIEGGPELPCICDLDCVCFPLCASDLTQNCLCEENGLFARVTEGANIDDLNVPDLVRPQASAVSSCGHRSELYQSPVSEAGSYVASHRPDSETFSQHSRPAVESEAMDSVMRDEDLNLDDHFTGLFDPVKVLDNSAGESNDVLIQAKGRYVSPYDKHNMLWSHGDRTAYQQFMREPWGKLCDTPPVPLPTRTSIVRSLFPGSRLARKLESDYVARLDAETKLTPENVTKSGRIAKVASISSKKKPQSRGGAT